MARYFAHTHPASRSPARSGRHTVVVPSVVAEHIRPILLDVERLLARLALYVGTPVVVALVELLAVFVHPTLDEATSPSDTNQQDH